MALETWALSEGLDGSPHTTAIRASYFAAVTSVLVPPLAGLSGERVDRAQAAGCVLAASGAALFALDQGSQPPSSALNGLGAGLSTGDVAVLGAAFFWAAFTVRLSALAQRPGARVVGISAARALVSLAFARVWAAWEASEGRLDLGSYLDWAPLSSGGVPLLPIAVLLFTALGSGALASTLQAYGQRGVGSARAQVVLSTTPLFTTILALALGLPGEGLSAAGAAGGGFIVAGSVLGSGVLEGRQSSPAGKETPMEDTP
jgi:drug/metabolite transporter (DMT)-like permease